MVWRSSVSTCYCVKQQTCKPCVSCQNQYHWELLQGQGFQFISMETHGVLSRSRVQPLAVQRPPGDSTSVKNVTGFFEFRGRGFGSRRLSSVFTSVHSVVTGSLAGWRLMLHSFRSDPLNNGFVLMVHVSWPWPSTPLEDMHCLSWS